MDKKIAVLIGGMYREFPTAHKTWSFLNHQDSDIFFSTWDETYEINEPLNINFKEIVTEKNIRDLIPNAFINISKDFNDDTTTLSSIKKIIYHWKTLLRMVKNTNTEYEYIVLTRPDMFFNQKKDLNSFIETIENDKIYGLTPVEILEKHPFYYVQDCFFLSKFNVIFKMIESLQIDSDYDDIHVMLSHYFIDNKIEVESLHPHVLDYFVARSVHRSFKNSTFEELKEIGLEWWHVKHDNHHPKILKK